MNTPAPHAPVETVRFTLDGDAGLEAHLAHVCARVRHEIAAAIPDGRREAVMLGGGYGRGEGGVLRSPTGDRPYNDLEFYVCLRGPPRLNERRHGATLHHLADTLSPEAGVEVEFKIISLRQLRQGPVTMFSHDLVMGHRWVTGEDRLLSGCGRHRDASLIPPAEATRLLLNRCSGLLFTRERLQGQPLTSEDADFAGRNLAKAQLALGDALLAAEGRYHWSCLERHRRLARLEFESNPAWFASVRQHHAAGVDFKLHPQLTSASLADELDARLAELIALSRRVWLWLETRRLGRSFPSVAEYALAGINKLPETSAWRNRLIHLRSFGWRSLWRAGAARYPREQLFNTLALLLWAPAGVTQTPLLDYVQQQLETEAVTLPDLVASYRGRWCQFR